jgi:hexosaminidase
MRVSLFVLFLMYFIPPVFGQNSKVKIIPQPSSITLAEGHLYLPGPVNVYVDPFSGLDIPYVTQILGGMGLKPVMVSKKVQGQISFLLTGKKSAVKDESYQLGVGKNNTISIISGSRKGLLHGLQTLKQLGKPEKKGLAFPRCTIADAPAFSWRAYLLDESRNFHGKEVVKDLMDEMARLKLNIFHWHLVDDPAWRLEIKRYPRLTEVTSKGNYGDMVHFMNSPNRFDSLFVRPPAQFYTQADIKEIVAYADVRGISVLPEIELPGHATASIYAYPWLGASSKVLGKGVHGDIYDLTDPKVEEFIHHIIDEVVSLFPGGVIHIGGDEANYQHWKDSKEINAFMKQNNIPTYADLQVWAINRLSKYISGKGYRMMGWNEITGDNIRREAHMEAGKSEKLAEGTVVHFWDGEVSLVNKAIEKGYDVVNSDRHHTYLDYPYEVTSFEKAYSFNPIPKGIAEKDRSKILGLGAQMWGEFTPNLERLYFQTFPRLAAYSEVGWVSAERKTSYVDFRERLKNIEKIWDAKGYLRQQKGKY